MLALTFDIDWADDKVLAYTLELLNQYDISATFFCTHRVCLGRHEHALHPNYDGLADREKAVGDLKDIFPEAHGVRSHRMDFALGRDIGIYEKFGISYDSNYAMPGVSGIAPYCLMNDLVEIPFYFGDGFQVLESAGIVGRFELDNWLPDAEGLKVFAFHPIHIYLNTDTNALYEQCRPYFNNPEKLWAMRNKGEGVGTFFINLLRYIHDRHVHTGTLREIEVAFRNNMAAQNGQLERTCK
jgi:hypothetical protein